MAAVGVRELESHRTLYLRRTQAGESMVITDRGRPVAILSPLPVGVASDTLEERLARLAARGALSLPAAQPLVRLGRVRVSAGPVSRAVVEDRR